MSCKVQVKTINRLKDNKVISNTREILNFKEFDRLNNLYTNAAVNKYGLEVNGNLLFTSESKAVKLEKVSKSRNRVIDRAIPNEDLFNKLDNIINQNEKIDEYKPYQKLLSLYEENSEPIFQNKTDIKIEDNYKNTNLLFNDDKLTVDNIVNNILQLKDFKNSDVEDFINKLLTLSRNSSATIKLVNDDVLKSDSLMEYNAKENTIFIPKDRINEVDSDQAINGFIHELVHSISVESYNNPQNTTQELFKKEVDILFNKLNDGSNKYGFSSPEEFIAEVFSNPEFRNNLDNKSIFKKIANFIKRLLGIKSKSEINNFIDNIVAISNETNENLNIDKIFQKKIEKDKDVDLDPSYLTITDQLERAIEKADVGITLNLKTLKKISNIKKSKGQDNAPTNEYIEALEELKNNLDIYKELDKFQAITLFAEQSKKSLYIIKNRFNNLEINRDTMSREEFMAESKKAIELYDTYLKSFSSLKDFTSLLNKLENSTIDPNVEKIFTNEEMNKLKEVLNEPYTEYSNLKEKFNTLKSYMFKNYINDVKYFPEIEKKHITRLRKEYKNKDISENREEWIGRKFKRDEKIIQRDVEEAVEKIIENADIDIDTATTYMASAYNINNRLISILQQKLNEINNKKINSERPKDQEFRKLFEKLRKEKGSNLTYKLYKNILDYDSDGNPYIKGEYSSEVYKIHLEIVENSKKLEELKNSKEDTKEEENKIRSKIIELNNQIYDQSSETGKVIKEKYKNDLSTLSETEKEIRDFFINIEEVSAKITFNRNSLIRKIKGQDVSFYSLPKISKSLMERIYDGSVSNEYSEFKKDMTEIRPDDFGYVKEAVDGELQPLNTIPIHYRGKLSPKEQSIDLFNMFRLEFKNTNSYKLRHEFETEISIFKSIADNKSIKATKGGGINKQINTYTNKALIKENEGGNISKTVNFMIEQQFYDIMNKQGLKMGKYDMNKVVSKVNNLNSFLSLSANTAASTANVLRTELELFFETVGFGRFIKAKSLYKAKADYGKQLPELLKDTTRPINMSFSNQLLEMFDVRGLIMGSNSDFLKSDLIKKTFSSDSLRVLMDGGEHYTQFLVGASILDGVKVMNKNNRYINKKGEIVATQEEAASIYEMLEMNPETNLLEISDKVVYTEHSKITKWNEGGKEKVDALIKKKISDVVGNYMEKHRAMMYRTWQGKLFGLYRKYLYPQTKRRLGGINKVTKRVEDLTEEDRKFNYGIQDYDEGTYTSLLRFLRSNIMDTYSRFLKKEKEVNGFKDNWDLLSDGEKHNIKTAAVEAATTSLMYPLFSMLLEAIDLDDDEYAYFLLYQIRRAEMEIQQFTNPLEAYKLFRSPVPSSQFFFSIIDIMNQTFSNPLEEYEGGDYSGENKLKVKTLKELPVLKEFMRNWERLDQFQNSYKVTQ